MALNYIWIAFFLIAFVVACIKVMITGDTLIFKTLMDATFSSSKVAVMDVLLPLTGIMTLWLGLLNIGEKAGAIRFLSRIVRPFFSRLFPDIPKDHPAGGHIIMNFSANMLGLGNAATPMGLKAMDSMQELNPQKDRASNSQIMFLVLNTSGFTLIPLTIIAQRQISGALNPSDVFVPILLATFCSTIVGILSVAIWQRINIFNAVMLSWILGISSFVMAVIWYFSTLSHEQAATVSTFAANFILFLIIIAFILGAIRKKVNVYEAFIEGAKTGFETTIKIIPYLVGMLVGIAVFRASGALDYLGNGIGHLFYLIGMNTDFVPALPTAFMKPLSGSGSRGLMIEMMDPKNGGPDTFQAKLSCVFQGAADTTFYIVALYFGSVGIKNTRYAVAAGLIADLAGVLAAIFICYMFFH